MIPNTVLAVTSTYSTIPVLLWDFRGQPNPDTSLKCECDPPPPPGNVPGYPLPCVGDIEPPPRVCSKVGGEAVRRNCGPWPGGRHTRTDPFNTVSQRAIPFLWSAGSRIQVLTIKSMWNYYTFTFVIDSRLEIGEIPHF